MRKVRPQDIRDEFVNFVDERLNHYDRVEIAVKGTHHEKRDMSILSETTLHSTYVAFECFISDLILAYINRDFSVYQSFVSNRINQSVESKFGNWAAGRITFARTKHIKAPELEAILDPESYNLTFKDVATLKQRLNDWVAAPHKDAIVNLNDPDTKLIDTVHSIRNFIAHQSKNAKKIMNTNLSNVVTGAACPNAGLSRGVHDIHDVGAFLKSMANGERRVKTFANRLSSIAQGL